MLNGLSMGETPMAKIVSLFNKKGDLLAGNSPREVPPFDPLPRKRDETAPELPPAFWLPDTSIPASKGFATLGKLVKFPNGIH